MTRWIIKSFVHNALFSLFSGRFSSIGRWHVQRADPFVDPFFQIKGKKWRYRVVSTALPDYVYSLISWLINILKLWAWWHFHTVYFNPPDVWFIFKKQQFFFLWQLGSFFDSCEDYFRKISHTAGPTILIKILSLKFNLFWWFTRATLVFISLFSHEITSLGWIPWLSFSFFFSHAGKQRSFFL